MSLTNKHTHAIKSNTLRGRAVKRQTPAGLQPKVHNDDDDDDGVDDGDPLIDLILYVDEITDRQAASCYFRFQQALCSMLCY